MFLSYSTFTISDLFCASVKGILRNYHTGVIDYQGCAWNCRYLRLCIFRFSCFAILSTNGDINPTHKTKALHSPLCFQVNRLSAQSFMPRKLRNLFLFVITKLVLLLFNDNPFNTMIFKAFKSRVWRFSSKTFQFWNSFLNCIGFDQFFLSWPNISGSEGPASHRFPYLLLQPSVAYIAPPTTTPAPSP